MTQKEVVASYGDARRGIISAERLYLKSIERRKPPYVSELINLDDKLADQFFSTNLANYEHTKTSAAYSRKFSICYFL